MVEQRSFMIRTGRCNDDCIDWGWPTLAHGWRKTSKPGTQFEDDGPLQEVDVPYLLRKFGLDEVYGNVQRPTLDALQQMSPADLIAVRRMWEKCNGKEPLEVWSDRRGGHIKAEECYLEVKAA